MIDWSTYYPQTPSAGTGGVRKGEKMGVTGLSPVRRPSRHRIAFLTASAASAGERRGRNIYVWALRRWLREVRKRRDKRAVEKGGGIRVGIPSYVEVPSSTRYFVPDSYYLLQTRDSVPWKSDGNQGFGNPHPLPFSVLPQCLPMQCLLPPDPSYPQKVQPPVRSPRPGGVVERKEKKK